MKVECRWESKMRFSAASESHQIAMDARPPIGDFSAMTPKHLLLAGICGCTGMDVVALLKKYKQPLESLEVDADADLTEGAYPAIFKEVKLVFRAKGRIEGEKLLEAVRLSQTKYCGVSAMVAKAVPLSYVVELNGTALGSGRADFG